MLFFICIYIFLNIRFLFVNNYNVSGNSLDYFSFVSFRGLIIGFAESLLIETNPNDPR